MSPLALSLHFLQAQPDGRLVALARDGHEPAFEALVRRYRKELLAYCRRLQPQTGSAEDALQQTFLQAWRALNRGVEVREVRPWLYRIAHNVSLNSRRALVAVPDEIPEVAAAQEVEQLVEQRLQARAALAEMAALPDLQRRAFVSATLDGASHEEVASALGLSSAAVRGLIYRARATLRAAAAAITPSPIMNWALRRVDARAAGASTAFDAVAGGGGVGLAAVLAKSGAVVTLAGAMAGVGGAILTAHAKHHRHGPPSIARAVDPGQPRASRVEDGSHAAFVAALEHRMAAHENAVSRVPGRSVETGRKDAGGRDGGSGEDRGASSHRDSAGSEQGSGGGLDGGSDGAGSPGGSGPTGGSPGASGPTSGGSDDGGRATTATSASGSPTNPGSGSSGSGGGSDGGSHGSDGGSVASAGSGAGGISGSGSAPSTVNQVSVTQTTTDGGSGTDGGESGPGSGGHDTSSGSGATTTTSGSH